MLVLKRYEIPFLAACDKSFRDGFQFFPSGADLFGFLFSDLIIGGSGGNDRQQIGEFLHDFIGGGNQVGRVGLVEFRVKDEKPAGSLADPLDDSAVLGTAQQRIQAIQRISAAAARGVVGRLGPLVDH